MLAKQAVYDEPSPQLLNFLYDTQIIAEVLVDVVMWQSTVLSSVSIGLPPTWRHRLRLPLCRGDKVRNIIREL